MMYLWLSVSVMTCIHSAKRTYESLLMRILWFLFGNKAVNSFNWTKRSLPSSIFTESLHHKTTLRKTFMHHLWVYGKGMQSLFILRCYFVQRMLSVNHSYHVTATPKQIVAPLEHAEEVFFILCNHLKCTTNHKQMKTSFGDVLRRNDGVLSQIASTHVA